MKQYVIGKQNTCGEMTVHCAFTEEQLGTLLLRADGYRYQPVSEGILAGEYTDVIRQYEQESLSSEPLRQAA